MSLTPFYIPDSSPILSYAGPGGWKSAYTPRGDGYDQTFHQVTGPGNEVSFNLTSAGFTVSHATVAPECPLEYSVNGSEFKSTCEERGGLSDLKYGLHQVVLRTGNVTVFQLFGIVGLYNKPADQKFSNTTLDDTSESFTYTPQASWSFLDDDGSFTGISDNGTKPDHAASPGRSAGNRSVAVTSESGSKVDLAFKGSAVYVYGRTGPGCGQAEVMLDRQVVAHINMTNTWPTDSMLLYTAGGLDGDKSHHLEFINTSSGKMAIDYAIITATTLQKGDTPLIPLIAGVVGGIVAIILLGVVVHLYLMARIRYKIRPTPSVREDVESWRKQTPIESAEACSPCEAYHDEGGMTGPMKSGPKSYTSAPSVSVPTSQRERRNSGKWPIAKLYTRQHRRSFLHLGSEGGSTHLSADPDYIPYKDPRAPIVPPVPALPPATGSTQRTLVPSTSLRSKDKGPVSPPAIVGLDSSAERWLHENTYVGNPPRPSSRDSHRSALSCGHSFTSRGDHDDPSTGSIEAYEIVGVTHTASHARRSVARLWPSPDAVPSLYGYGSSSLYRSNTLTHAHGPEAVVNNVSLRRTNTLDSFGHGPNAIQTVPVSASASATAGIGTFSSFSSSFIRPPPTPLTLLTTPSSAQPSAYTPSSRNRPQTPLRRGVSIKSAKTVRSFFSNWVRGGPDVHTSNDNGTGMGLRPDTPARPQTAARPDSGIFPLSLGLGTAHIPFSQMEDRERGGGANMFIELDPSSPLTASRPPSEWQGKRILDSRT